MTRRYESMEERIIANSVLVDDCWIWTGKTVPSRGGRGRSYPVLTVRMKGKGPRNVRVHRLVLEVFKGVHLTRVHVAAHRCNNTFCVNPEHLYRATQRVNIQQCLDDSRHVSGFAHAAAKRDFEDLEAAA